MSDNNLEEKNSANEPAENLVEKSQVEANASLNEEVAETAQDEILASNDDSAEPIQEEANAEQEEVQETVVKTASIDSEEDNSDDEEDELEEEVNPLESVSVEDFNWDAYEQDVSDYNQSDRNRLEEMYSETLSHVDERQVLDGTIVSINDRDVVVNIGFKSDGMVSLSEFRYLGEDLKEGAIVKIMVEKREDAQGQIKLSHKKALEESAWDTIVDANENDKIGRAHV